MKQNLWIYQVWMYFDYMSELNNTYISLVKGNYHNIQKTIEKQIYKLFELITKIIPYGIKDEGKKCKVKMSSEIFDLFYNSSCNDIVSEIKNLVVNDNTILYSIKSIRNNTEHSPHRILCASILKTNNNLSYFELSYTKTDFSNDDFDIENLINTKIDITDLSSLVRDLNTIFLHIKEKIKKEYDG